MSKCNYCGKGEAGDTAYHACDDCLAGIDPTEAAYQEAEELGLSGEDARDFAESEED